MLTREEILNAGNRRPHVDVDCTDEAGGVVRIAVMTGAERDMFDKECAAKTDGGQIDTEHLRAALICLTLSGESGERLLTLDDVDAVKGWQAPLLWKLYTVAFRLNKLGAHQAEALEKN